MKKRVLLLTVLCLIVATVLCLSACGLVGKDGDSGVGIASIQKTDSSGLVDTYTITLTDGGTSTFTVTNGKDADDSLSADPDALTSDNCFRFQLLENGTYEVLARYHDMPNRVVVPSVYNGKAVTRVGDYFSGEVTGVYNRSVEEIVLPSSINEIGNNAFFSYVSLSSITLPTSIRSIESGAFLNCVSLKSITIPDGVQTIESSTFERCSGLTSITIPSTVTAIKSWSFVMCESLTSITFKGTKAQWNSIEKYGDSEEIEGTWNRRTGNYTVYCTDGDIAKE